MRSVLVVITAAMTACAPFAVSQQDGPCKILETVRVGGEGGWDYIYADTYGRRLYIPRGATHACRQPTPLPKWLPFPHA